MYPASHQLTETLVAERRREAAQRRTTARQLADAAPRWWRLQVPSRLLVTARPATHEPT